MPKTKSTTPRLTAQRKLELYRATRAPDAPIGELLRQAGVHLDDLREIEQTIEALSYARGVARFAEAFPGPAHV